MDPKTGQIYSEDEIPALDEETQKRLIRGELEDLQQMSALLKNVEEENAKSEEFYPINRAARRNAEKRNRALKKRKPNG